MKLDRLTIITFKAKLVAEEEDKLERMKLALDIMNLAKDEDTENYLRRYYAGN